MRKEKFLMLLLSCLFTICSMAHGPGPHFDPERFEADMEQFIVTQAGLNPQEAAAFFPVFREMQRKQRAIFGEMNRYRHTDTTDNIASMQAIKKMDQADVEMKKIQQQYHLRFFKVLPAGKVLKVIKAEDEFHRRAFRRAIGHDSHDKNEK